MEAIDVYKRQVYMCMHACMYEMCSSEPGKQLVDYCDYNETFSRTVFQET